MNIIEVKNLSKVYNLYNKPIDRLKEALDFRKKQYHTKLYALNNISLKKSKPCPSIGPFCKINPKTKNLACVLLATAAGVELPSRERVLLILKRG